MPDFILIASSLIGALAGGGLVSAILSWATAQKRIITENITQERAQWRATIRRKAIDVHDAIIDGDANRIARLRCEFRTLLNPCDTEDDKIIEAMEPLVAKNCQRPMDVADEFAKRVSWLLKHDWERAKLETTNTVFRLKGIHKIPGAFLYTPSRPAFSKESDSAEPTVLCKGDQTPNLCKGLDIPLAVSLSTLVFALILITLICDFLSR